jgi:hypothetical protein
MDSEVYSLGLDANQASHVAFTDDFDNNGCDIIRQADGVGRKKGKGSKVCFPGSTE